MIEEKRKEDTLYHVAPAGRAERGEVVHDTTSSGYDTRSGYDPRYDTSHTGRDYATTETESSYVVEEGRNRNGFRR